MSYSTYIDTMCLKILKLTCGLERESCLMMNKLDQFFLFIGWKFWDHLFSAGLQIAKAGVKRHIAGKHLRKS